MSWLNPIAPMSPIAAATGTSAGPAAASASVTLDEPENPAAQSNTVGVGCSRKDSRVVLASVVSIDSSDHAYSDTPMPSAAAWGNCARHTSQSVPSTHRAPSRENCGIGNVSTAPSAGR